MTALALACLLSAATLPAPCHTPRPAERPVWEPHRVVPVVQRAHLWRT